MVRQNWAKEAGPDAFTSRLAWAAGYQAESTYVEASYCVESGRIDGPKLEIGPGGVFHGGRFQFAPNLRNSCRTWTDPGRGIRLPAAHSGLLVTARPASKFVC